MKLVTCKEFTVAIVWETPSAFNTPVSVPVPQETAPVVALLTAAVGLVLLVVTWLLPVPHPLLGITEIVPLAAPLPGVRFIVAVLFTSLLFWELTVHPLGTVQV